MKKAIFIVILVLLLGVSGFFVVRKNSKSNTNHSDASSEIHYHAGFVVFKNGVKENFAEWKYMKVNPCMDDEGHKEELTSEEEQLEKAHLHDRIGDVVHMHRDNVTWKDLFANISYEIDPTSVIGYVNGQHVDIILDQKIHAYDSAVIFVNEKEDSNRDYNELLKEAVTEEHIQKVEQKSESC